MKNLLTDKTCDEFSRLLASKSSVPGGGGAAAIVGALGAALCSMAGNFTVGKKKYIDVEEDIKAILLKAERIRARLIELVDEDAKAFLPLSEAYSIPKDDPKRPEILESASLNACKAPVEMVMLSAEAIDLLAEMLEKGSRLLISDVGCGALLCCSAMEAAAMNVYINTGTLKGNHEAEELESKIDSILSEYSPKAHDIALKVKDIIRRK